MADTLIAGAEQPLGIAGAALDSGLPDLGGPAVDILDTPDAPWINASFDQFQKAMQQGSTYPGSFAGMLDPNVETGKSPGNREALVKYAKSFLGVDYVWGGSGPSGFDCSGLTQYVAAKFGVNLPRISYQQANAGKRTDIGALQAGDLVAWDENKRNNGADHIAFYIGNGYILEAPHTGAQVRIRKLGKNEGAWGVHLDYPGG
jgi:cell wall-associated NlpC family hydrolase